ncbi:MAG: hypothetical protein KatS3mg057_0281 [Herpetosiphonaceae bacterium]|nr:MAG: hypothetical protein KatS3mg057_0281 [Herpetosiphonaceae bacterium]
MITSTILRHGRLIAAVALGVLVLWSATAQANQQSQFSDPVKQGEYLANIAGCIGCHTPVKADLSFDTTRLYSGGRPFELGPLGVLFSRNLTSDVETGLGAWSDEEIKTAIRSGRSRDGHQIFPIMPYHIYNNMAEADLDAIVAYLRTLPPIKNEIPRQQLVPEGSIPQLPIKQGIVAPSPSDTAARGRYLMTAVTPCTDCHTPVDPATSQPILSQYLAGSQPFEGPWGTIYGGNITPDKATGIGNWSDEDLKRVITKGIRPDGRYVVLMPWEEYIHLTAEDLDAIIYYLRNEVQPVSRQVPGPALNPEFIRYAPEEVSRERSLPVLPILAGALVIGGLLVVLLLRRRASKAG